MYGERRCRRVARCDEGTSLGQRSLSPGAGRDTTETMPVMRQPATSLLFQWTSDGRGTFACVLFATFALACGAKRTQPPVTPRVVAEAQQPELSDEAFAPSVVRLLRGGDLGWRAKHLAPIVRKQLERSLELFRAGHKQAALLATQGAFFLARSGELPPQLLAGHEETLLRAAAVVARRGDEGQARAFYRLASAAAPDGPRRAEIAAHLEAIGWWQATTRAEGSVRAFGSEQAARVQQALIERTKQTVDAASESVHAWIDRSLQVNWDGPPQSMEELAERQEARLAQRQGVQALVATHLRDGDAAAAAAALDVETFSFLRGIRDKLNAAANGEAEAWAELFGNYKSQQETRSGSDYADVARGAAWGAAVELMRAEPRSMRAVLPLGTLLLEHGMGDIAPAIFSQAVGTNPDSRQLNWALMLILRGLAESERLHQLPLARRIFANSRPLLELAASPNYADVVQPNAADFYYLMGAIEARAGDLERARPHLQKAQEFESTPDALRLLSAIELQRGEPELALKPLQTRLELAKSASSLNEVAATQLLVFDVLRDSGDRVKAEQALEQALRAALSSRQSAQTTSSQAAAERHLANALEHYGERRAARRAQERAREGSLNNLRQLSAVHLETVRRALTGSDLQAGRFAVRHAMADDIGQGDLTYAALWLKLLELRVKATSDGTVEEALAAVDPEDRWVRKLRDWGRGTLSDEGLIKQARSVVQETEARFYVSVSGHFANPTARTQVRLRSVATGSTIELVEVRIARDVLRGPYGARLPANITLP